MAEKKYLKPWLKWLLRVLGIVVVLIGTLLAIVVWKQEAVVQEVLKTVNQRFAGKISLEGSHISPFENFPYISIDLEGLKLFETKDETLPPLVAIQDAYLGFDILEIISGKYDLKAISLSDGYVKVAQHTDGSFNIVNALTSLDTTSQVEEQVDFQLHLKAIKLHNVDIHKINESTEIDIDAFVNDAAATLKTNGTHTLVDLDARFEMNLMQAGDTTLIKHKHFDVQTKIDFDSEAQLLQIAPSEVKLESGEFALEGKLDIANNQYLDLKVEGAKPNFDLIIAFAPEALIPTLQSYDNRGEVYFEALVQGELATGAIPKIEAKFGCREGFIKNTSTDKSLEEMQFSGYFRNPEVTTGLAAMEFGIQDFRAKPETGEFYGDLKVRNFVSPEIDLKLNSEFKLGFLTDFFNIKGLSDLSGKVNLTMNFHDIIDLNNPEKSIERLNESYFTELEIRNLNFKSESFYLPIQDINVIGHIEGHEAVIDTLSGRIGTSDIFAMGRVSDLPAILHHTEDSIWVDLKLKSNLLDIAELTFNDSTQKAGVDEQIRDLRLDIGFNSSARAFTEYKNLPSGEFFIRELHATLQHYPHELHDFNADVFIEEEDIRIVDFSGELDSSDFHFSGRFVHYDIWLNDILDGDAELEFDLTSDHLRLEDLMVYKGENYVPEDYRHEQFDQLKLHGRTVLHFKQHEFYSVDLYLEQLNCKMKLHNCRFEQFKGRLHYEDQHLTTNNFEGRIGRSDFHVDLYWYLGKDPLLRKKNHFVTLRSDRLDINQLLEWNPAPSTAVDTAPVDHDAGFTIFDVPFWDMHVRADIKQLLYHQYKIEDLKTVLHMTSNRHLEIDTCLMDIAGGSFDIRGDFDATNPEDIYFSPQIYAQNVDIDRFMVKFDNFGQDYVLSDNLHGIVNGAITGKLHIHKDLTPILDQSDFTLDVQVLNGRLDNYQPLEYLEDFFKDKNLKKVRFDTLENTFVLKNNILEVPNMTINSSLGFIELWGTQSLGADKKMDMFFKVPLKLVTQAAFQKLFKRKKEAVDPSQEDAIEYQDKGKKIPYIYVNLLADANGYNVKLQRDKDRLQEQRKQRREARQAARKKELEARRNR